MDTSDRAGAVTGRVPGGVEPTTKLLVKGGEGERAGGVVGDSIPPNTLLKQEGLQLAEASFPDMASNPLKWMIETGINWI